jgi:hypothetical protein
MSVSRPIQWYHSHVDPIWLDGTFKIFNFSIKWTIFREDARRERSGGARKK